MRQPPPTLPLNKGQESLPPEGGRYKDHERIQTLHNLVLLDPSFTNLRTF